MRLTEVGTPVTTSDGKDGELGDDDGGADGGCDFLGGLDAETNVAFAVADDDDCLESGSLTGSGLLLDRLDLRCISTLLSSPERRMYLHNLILELWQKPIDDLILLDGKRM
jgi:hypothetical protein